MSRFSWPSPDDQGRSTRPVRVSAMLVSVRSAWVRRQVSSFWRSAGARPASPDPRQDSLFRGGPRACRRGAAAARRSARICSARRGSPRSSNRPRRGRAPSRAPATRPRGSRARRRPRSASVAALVPVEEGGSERPSIARGTVPPMPLDDRRHDVDRLGQCLDHAPARRVGLGRGIADDERYMERRVEVDLLCPHVMLAQHLGMVAGDDDQRVVVFPGLLQVLDDPADVDGRPRRSGRNRRPSSAGSRGRSRWPGRAGCARRRPRAAVAVDLVSSGRGAARLPPPASRRGAAWRRLGGEPSRCRARARSAAGAAA